MEKITDLLEISKEIVAYGDRGDPITDVIDKTPYWDMELLYKLACFYVQAHARG